MPIPAAALELLATELLLLLLFERGSSSTNMVHIAVMPEQVLEVDGLLTSIVKFPATVGVRFVAHERVLVTVPLQDTVKTFVFIAVPTFPVVPAFVREQVNGLESLLLAATLLLLVATTLPLLL